MTKSKPISIAVMVSGNGTNLQAIIDAIEKKTLNAQIVVVISNNPNAYALERAKKHGLISVIHDHETAIIQTILESGASLICLAGFMKILSPKFISQFSGKIINIHPSLLPKFPGLHAQRQALLHGAKVSGCTVHFVNEGMDAGPIILQAEVSVLEDDTEETLSARILKEEHRLYPKAIGLIAEGRVKIDGGRILIAGK